MRSADSPRSRLQSRIQIGTLRPIRVDHTKFCYKWLLKLIHSFMGDTGAEFLAGVLAQCTALTHLDLSGNEIGPAGAERLSGVLAQCAALTHLDLSVNQIGDTGAEFLGGVLAQCTALTHLNLYTNEIGHRGREPCRIADAVTALAMIGVVTSSSTACTSGGWWLILQTCFYHHIRICSTMKRTVQT